MRSHRLPKPDRRRALELLADCPHDSNAKIGWEATITSVNFRVKGGIWLVRADGKKIKRW